MIQSFLGTALFYLVLFQRKAIIHHFIMKRYAFAMMCSATEYLFTKDLSDELTHIQFILHAISRRKKTCYA